MPEKVEDGLAVDGLFRGTAILKSFSSSADNNDEPGKEEDEHALAVDGLRLGNLIAYSSSKMCFLGSQIFLWRAVAVLLIRVLQPLLLINSLHYVLEAVFRCIFSEVTQHVY